MTSAEEILVQEIDGLSEEDARDVLALVERKRNKRRGKRC